MTPKQAKKIDHYHLRWPDGVIGEQPYRTAAAARGHFTIRGEAVEGFRTVKVRAGGKCPCTTPRVKEGGDAGTKQETPGTWAAAALDTRCRPSEISEQQYAAHNDFLSGGNYRG